MLPLQPRATLLLPNCLACPCLGATCNLSATLLLPFVTVVVSTVFLLPTGNR